MKERATRTTIWLWLTIPISILLAVATVSELFVEDLLNGTPYFLAQAIGQDVVTLSVALPALVIGAIFVARGSERARLVWLGALTYLVYTYVIYAFQVQFNRLFLAYVALLGCSLYALIGGLACTDFARIKARFMMRTLIRTTSVFLGIIAFLFYFSWLGEVVPALVAGEVPQSVTDNGTPTNAVHVLDMAWILPAAALTAIWLWRKRPLGYTLAGLLLTFFSLLALAIVAIMVSMSLYSQTMALGMAVVFGVMAAASLGLMVWYMRGLKEEG